MDKQQTVDKYGKDQVAVWRRSYGERDAPVEVM
jgi:bisphosphoglycerate-dependent phosphoglycerate mutase